MYVPKPNDNDFAPPPAGTFPAICYRVIDLGTQPTTWQGQIKHQHKVLISWEIADAEEKMEDGRPWTISASYTWSMSEKANLRHMLESWRGKKFTDADFGEGGFDIKNIIGQPCMLAVVHNPKGDKVYANVSAISKLPKMLQPAPIQNETVYFAMTEDRFNRDTLAKLSDTLQGKIKASPEYQRLTGGLPREQVNGDYDEGNPPPRDQMDDEIPF